MADGLQAGCERCTEIARLAPVVDGRSVPTCEACLTALTLPGYRSLTADHFHDQPPYRMPVMLCLCKACYLKDHAAFYPNLPLPILQENTAAPAELVSQPIVVAAEQLRTDEVPVWL